MSTRCQVKIVDTHRAVTLYHHWDGYPSYMIPVLQKAFKEAHEWLEQRSAPLNPKQFRVDPPFWKLARAGYAAAFLCHYEPDQFEPEDGHDLHGDIEYYYVIDTDVTHSGALSKPSWRLTVYTSHPAGNQTPGSGPDRMCGMYKLCDRVPIMDADGEKMEALENP